MKWLIQLAHGYILTALSSNVQDQRVLQNDGPAVSNLDGSLGISSSWSVLGPFQIGTREAAWGADPLEYYGSFSSLTPESHPKIPSSVAEKGEAKWITVTSKRVPPKANISGFSSNRSFLRVSYPDIDWPFLQRIYGWSATQWQAWARTNITVKAKGGDGDRSRPIQIFTDHVIELKIDGERYFGGDFFAYRRTPLILWLPPGNHLLELRLIRDVRSMGGLDTDPAVEVNIEIREALGFLELLEGSILLSDVVSGQFAMNLGSITVINTGLEDVVVDNIQAGDEAITVEPGAVPPFRKPLTIASGQTRPITFYVSLLQPRAKVSSLSIHYHAADNTATGSNLIIPISLQHSDIYSPHKVTSRHPSGIISYFVLRPPSKNATCSSDEPAPGIVLLHGAGVEADDPIARDSFKAVPNLCAWLVYPSGVTSWSGDDWHTWGWQDVINSIYFTISWAENTGWKGVQFDPMKIIFTGHSNGGQGVWYALTHYPQAIAAAPVSGYLAIQQYVPYNMWSQGDPSKLALQQASLANFRHEMLAPMAKGIPIYQQHGGSDDNVPAYHSRFMHELITESGWKSNYSELPGKGHWWEDVMTTPGLVDFYYRILDNPELPSLDDLESFEIVIADPFSTWYKFGVRVLYLQEPGRLGRLKISLNKKTNAWRIVTENVMIFEIAEDSPIAEIEIDDMFAEDIKLFKVPKGQKRQFIQLKDKSWMLTDMEDLAIEDRPIRQPREFGGLDALLRMSSGDEHTIKFSHKEVSRVALQISRNLHQYFAADTALEYSPNQNMDVGYSIKIIAGECYEETCADDVDFPIQIPIETGKLRIRDSDGLWIRPGGSSTRLGAIYLRPSKAYGLELVIWAETIAMLEQAARLVPMITGTGQPDFVIVREDARWRGVDGSYLGFFDAWWNVSKSSIVV